jgi:hypothetical protein
LPLERATNGITRRIKPPTREELAEAARRGHTTVSSKVLAEIRTAAKTKKQNIPAVTPVPTSNPSSTLMDSYVAKIRQQAAEIISLKNKITVLKVESMRHS